MTIDEAVKYINAHTWSQWKLGLSRTRELLRLLGDPQKKLRFVHVAGSNGKGSTCAMLERILREAGYVTGFYPSPYIEEFRERIQVCGSYITQEALCRITERVAAAADSMEDHPTQFELITAIGMVYFAEKNCEIVLLEVGLGGIYDSTNIIDAPEAAVITNIGLEHTEYLGSTLAEIAGNKCGIIKPGSDVVCYENVPEVMDVVRAACEKNACPLHIARFDRIIPVSRSLDGQVFYWKEPEEGESPGLRTAQAVDESPEETSSKDGKNAADTEKPGLRCTLSLPGEYQLHNAATALTTVEALRKRGWNIPEEAVRCGLEAVRWPARFEVLSREPLFILDGGHNPQCAQALAGSLDEYLPQPESGYGNEKSVFLIGMLADKDYEKTIDILAPYAERFVCLTPDSPRAIPAEKLALYLQGRGFQAEFFENVKDGLTRALSLAGQTDRPVIAFGSLYLAGAVRHSFPDAFARHREKDPGYLKRESGYLKRDPGQLEGDSVCLKRENGHLKREPREASCRDEEHQKMILEKKRRQRKEAAARRRSLTEEQRREKSAAVCRILLSLPELKNARMIFSYAASAEEVSLDDINQALEIQGKSVCFPVTGENGTMTAVAPKAQISEMAEELPYRDSFWRIGPYGIREPAEDQSEVVDPAQIDAVLVPCVAFDKKGGRCGHGAGYYDRFLAGLPQGVPKILAAFQVQEMEDIAMEETDVRMDLCVTENGVAFRAKR